MPASVLDLSNPATLPNRKLAWDSASGTLGENGANIINAIFTYDAPVTELSFLYHWYGGPNGFMIGDFTWIVAPKPSRASFALLGALVPLLRRRR